MQHVFTHAAYADSVYAYGYCDGSATAAVVKNTVGDFVTAEFRFEESFTNFSPHCVRVVHFPPLMFHLNVKVNKMWW